MLQNEVRRDREEKCRLRHRAAEWSLRAEAVNELARTMQEQAYVRDQQNQRYISHLERRLNDLGKRLEIDENQDVEMQETVDGDSEVSTDDIPERMFMELMMSFPLQGAWAPSRSAPYAYTRWR